MQRIVRYYLCSALVLHLTACGSSSLVRDDAAEAPDRDRKNGGDPSGVGDTKGASDASAVLPDIDGGTGPDADVGSLPDIPALPDGPIETVTSSCPTVTGMTRGNGSITRTTRPVTAFEGIDGTLPGYLVVQEGTVHRVQVETDANLQSNVVIGVRQGTLFAQTSGSGCYNRLRVIVTVPAFTRARAASAVKMTIEKVSAASDVTLVAADAAELTFSGDAKVLDVTAAEASTIVLGRGSAISTRVSASGAATVDGSAFAPGAVTKDEQGAATITF